MTGRMSGGGHWLPEMRHKETCILTAAGWMCMGPAAAWRYGQCENGCWYPRPLCRTHLSPGPSPGQCGACAHAGKPGVQVITADERQEIVLF